MDPQDIIDDIGRVCGIEYPTLSAIKSGYAVDAQREVCRRLETSLLAPLPQCLGMFPCLGFATPTATLSQGCTEEASHALARRLHKQGTAPGGKSP